MKLTPLGNRIVVKPDEIEDKTSSGIILVKETPEKPTTGKVLVGNDTVKKGDRVLFSKFGFDEVIISKELLYVVSEQNILGIFK